ncbi:MAG TPA: MDR family MFS transporter [Nocardioides sp.]|nr:MDR family MFS transporter [Nocardioides sp.]
MSEQATADTVGTGEYTHQQILTIMSGLMLGMFLGSLDQTIVSTSIRTISDDLHGLSAQAWVTTAYLVTSTITTPIYGKLGDLWGRKKLFMFAISIFILGSLLCTLSTSMYELAAFRAFQGLGAGGLFTLVLAIIGDIVPPLQRAKYTGYFMATFGTSSVLGPVIGGLLAGQATILGVAGWRWVFLVNVPIGLIALVVVYRTLHVHHVRRDAKVDWRGALALVVCLVPLLVVLEQGRSWGWGSGRSITSFVIAAIGLVAFLWAENRAGLTALIPLKLFTIRPAAVTIVASVIVGAGMFGGMLLLPLYMQIVHGASPTKSGLLMLPLVFGLMAASTIAGQVISRTGKTRMFPILGSTLMTLGLFLLTTIDASTPLWRVDLFMFVLGYGVGNCMQPLILTVQSAVPPQAIGVATSSATFFRQIGGTVGIAVFLSIMFSGVSANMSKEFHATPAAGVQAKEHASQLAGITDDSAVINTFPEPLQHSVKQAFAESMTPVFWIAGGLGILAIGVLLLMPEVELRKTSANAAVRQAAAAASD